jgi:hypothetical protein
VNAEAAAREDRDALATAIGEHLIDGCRSVPRCSIDDRRRRCQTLRDMVARSGETWDALMAARGEA